MTTVIVDKKVRAERMHHEKIVDDQIRGYVYIGDSLNVLNQEKYWKDAGYKSFKDYIEDRWPFTRQHAYKMIEASRIYSEMLKRRIERLPNIMDHAVALLEGADGLDDQIRLWNESVDRVVKTGKKMTTKVISTVANELFPKVSEQTSRPSITQSEVQENHLVRPESEIIDVEAEPKDPPQNVEVPNAAEAGELENGNPSSEIKREDCRDAACRPDGDLDSIDTKSAKHLVDVIPSAKKAKQFQRKINEIKKELVEYAMTKGGSYLNIQDCERLCDQLRVNIKDTAFECNCPTCKNRVVKTCKACEGRGFISQGLSRMLTDADKKWLKSQESPK